MSDKYPELLLSESDNRYDLIGLDLCRRDSGEVESFTRFGRDEIDMPGYVERVERGYEGTAWVPIRVWRTHTQPGSEPVTGTVALDAAIDYVNLVARIHEVYRSLVMDTDEDRALHARHVETADKALALAQRQLASARLDLSVVHSTTGDWVVGTRECVRCGAAVGNCGHVTRTSS